VERTRVISAPSPHPGGLAMKPLWHGLLSALAIILLTVASFLPPPLDRLIAGLGQLCQIMAELLK
jgi:hypothetical protein